MGRNVACGDEDETKGSLRRLGKGVNVNGNMFADTKVWGVRGIVFKGRKRAAVVRNVACVDEDEKKERFTRIGRGITMIGNMCLQILRCGE